MTICVCWIILCLNICIELMNSIYLYIYLFLSSIRYHSLLNPSIWVSFKKLTCWFISTVLVVAHAIAKTRNYQKSGVVNVCCFFRFMQHLQSHICRICNGVCSLPPCAKVCGMETMLVAHRGFRPCWPVTRWQIRWQISAGNPQNSTCCQ